MHNINNNSNESNSNISNTTSDNSNISNKGNTPNIASNLDGKGTEMLYPSEVALLLKVSLQTLRRWYKEDKLSARMTPGGQLRIPKSEVTRLLGRFAPVEIYDPRKDPNALVLTPEDFEDADDSDFVVSKQRKVPNFNQIMSDDKDKAQQQEWKQEMERAKQLRLKFIKPKNKGDVQYTEITKA